MGDITWLCPIFYCYFGSFENEMQFEVDDFQFMCE